MAGLLVAVNFISLAALSEGAASKTQLRTGSALAQRPVGAIALDGDVGGGANVEESQYCRRMHDFRNSSMDPTKTFKSAAFTQNAGCSLPRFASENVSVIVAHHSEDTQWTKTLVDSGAQVLVREAEGQDETIAFLSYMFEMYEQLPPVSIFLHGSSPCDWHSPKNILDIVQRVDADKLLRMGGYANLNARYHVERDDNASEWGQWDEFHYRMDCLWKEDDWVKQLKAKLSLAAEERAFRPASAYCCAQFAAHRDSIRRFPKSFYKSMLRRFRDAQPWDHNSYFVYGRTAEYLWHIVLSSNDKVTEKFYNSMDYTRPEGAAPAPRGPRNPSATATYLPLNARGRARR